jgi:hypothetical protein
MPGRKIHLFFGFVIGCFHVILALYLIKVHEVIFTVSEPVFLAMLGLGALFFMQISIATVASLLPDFIEPPTSKYHRGLFHSQFMFIIISLLNLMSFLGAIIASDLATKILSVLLSAMISGYTSHLLLDYPLPKFTRNKSLRYLHRW